jgi:hypothetical protein
MNLGMDGILKILSNNSGRMGLFVDFMVSRNRAGEFLDGINRIDRIDRIGVLLI